MRRWLLTVLLLYGVVPAGQAQAAAAPEITWEVCPEVAEVRCGTIRVPADWSDPAGPKIMVTVARRPAADPERRIGTLFVNPGGPGESAVNFTFDANTYFGAEVVKRFDIIGMDPRGVGRSSPVLCDQDLVDGKPNPLIATARDYVARIAYNRKLAADCAARTGPHFAHVDSASVARDMDAVRAALGEPQVSFYGASYGTLLGTQYAQMFPGRLRAMVLDSVMDHSADVSRFLVQEAEAVQDAFGQFIAWCTRDPSCALRGQDIRRIWSRLATRANAGTLVDPYDRTTKLRMIDLLRSALTTFADPPQWFSFAHYLRDAYGQRPLSRSARPEPPDITDYSFPAVVCEDWNLPITGFPDLSNRLRILRARAPQMLASPLALDAVTGCLGWPSTPDNPQRRLLPAPTLPPSLIVNARHDPTTPHAWASNVASALGPSSTLLTYQGWGHVVYKRSKCVASVADRYLLTLLPPPGTSCPPIAPKGQGVG